MLTLDQLNRYKPGDIITKGTTSNSEEGIFMTSHAPGRELLWVAKVGGINDWAIYIGWKDGGMTHVIQYGDKVTDITNIRKLVPCTDEALEMYRF